MDIQTVFKRYKIKYFLTQTQMQELKQQSGDHPIILPSIENVTTCHGINFPLF